MQDEGKTKAQLIEELEQARAALEAATLKWEKRQDLDGQAEDQLRTRLAYQRCAAQSIGILAESGDIDDRLSRVLSGLRCLVGACRAYVFKNEGGPKADLCMTQVVESCSDDTAAQIDNPELQRLPYEEAAPSLLPCLQARRPWIRMVSELEGREREILESQHIVSLVIVPIFARDDLWGFMGFDDCVQPRRWQDEDVEVLQTIADATGTAIVRWQAEEALEKRILTLTRPSRDATELALEDLFNLDDIQRLQDEFAQATGVASIITDTDGTPITRPSSFCRLCNDIIRKTERGRANCFESDAILGRYNPAGPTIQVCMSGGLWDAGAAISVGGQHLANWLIGQVRDETQTEDKIREYAREIGASEEETVTAFHEVTPMSRERFGKVAQVLFTLAKQLSATAYQNMQQARFIAELREAEERFRDLAEMLPEVVFETDAEANIIYTNRRGFELFGYTPEDLAQGLAGLDLLAPEDRDRASNDLARRITGEVAGAVEYLAQRKDGSIFPMLFHMSPITVAGEVVGLRGVVVDITARKRSEQALRESEERLQTMFSSSADFVMLLDREHRIQMINRLAAGLEPSQVVGALLYELALPEDRLRVKAHLDRVVQEAVELHYDTAHPSPDGTVIHFSSIASPITVSGQVMGSVVSSRDESYRIKLENERDRLEEQYRHSQKMEAIGRLAGGVAHDFNNVLSAITGNASLALADLPGGDPLEEPLEEIVGAAKRATDLTRQLLAFSRKQVIAPKAVDLSELIESLHSMLVRLIGEDVILRTLPQKGLGRVRVDPAQLEQIVLNLAVNARDAMPDGGKLLIETADVMLDDDYCATHANVTPGAYVMLAVSDTGFGMSAEVRERIFEPFFTTKQLGQGTGLGLATVFGIVEQNGGKIEVYSELEKGSSFKVYFPRVADKAESIRRPDGSEPPGGQETVLVVEDEDMVRNLAVRILTRRGYTVLAASSGQEALAVAEEHGDTIDLLLTDVVMPHMNGRELAAKLTEMRPRIKVLYTSGYTQNVIAHHGVLDEGVQFIPKPYSLDSLSARVRELLDQKA